MIDNFICGGLMKLRALFLLLISLSMFGQSVDKLPTLAEAMANWAWAVTNGEPAANVVATAHPIKQDFAKLDLALGTFGQVGAKYNGQKKGGGGEPWYYPNYERVGGPDFKLAKPVNSMPTSYVFMLNSKAVSAGLVPLKNTYNAETYKYPSAAGEDEFLFQELKDDRRVVESRLLAQGKESHRDRVCMFRYENKPEDALFVIAYFREDGERFVFEQTTTMVDKEGAIWRADAEPDDICSLDALMLCHTQEGPLLVMAWSAPEGANTFVLHGVDGQFKALPLDGMYYDPWEDRFFEQKMEVAEGVEEAFDGALKPSEIGEFVHRLTDPEEWDGAYGFKADPNGAYYHFGAFASDGDTSWDGMHYKELFTASSALAPQGNARYDAANLQNNKDFGGDRSLAWCEGVKGRGIGEHINMRITTQGHNSDDGIGFFALMIVNGYAKNQTVWKNNGRVKILRLYVGDKHWCDLHLVDTIKPQIFRLPEHLIITPDKLGKKVAIPAEWNPYDGLKTSAYQTDLSFEIIDVYPGDKFEDTCITGIALDGFSNVY
jgi:hypothetical protein